MKICFFNSCKVWGGGEKWHLEIATELKTKGHDVLICSSTNSELLIKAKEKRIKVEEFNIGNLTFLNLFKMYKLKKFFMREKFDIIILNLPSDLKSAGVACKLLKNTKIIYRRGSAIPIKDSFTNRILFTRVVDYIIANSDETKKSIIKNNENLFDIDKIFTIYNGIDIEEYNKREYKIRYVKKENEIVIGNAGRLSKQKNQKFIIDLADYMKTKEIKFKILIAGKGELEETLKEEVKLRNLEDEIIFLGFIENIKEFMKSIDLFILPSYWEGFGYVMVEAMLCEKPVIAFNTSSNPEIVEDDKCGFLIDIDNIEQCYKKILFLKENHEKAKDIGNYGKKYSEGKFSINSTLEKLEEVFNIIKK